MYFHLRAILSLDLKAITLVDIIDDKERYQRMNVCANLLFNAIMAPCCLMPFPMLICHAR